MSEPIFFWGGIYSQWYKAAFFVDGVMYPTAEHFMMASKALTFGDHVTLTKIFETSDPREAKKLGRQIRGWDDKVWEAVRFQVVCRGSYEKFRQNPELRDELIATGGALIVEASPTDKIWGVGLDQEAAAALYNDYDTWATWEDVPYPIWPGLNLLGQAIMLARALLTPR